MLLVCCGKIGLQVFPVFPRARKDPGAQHWPSAARGGQGSWNPTQEWAGVLESHPGWAGILECHPGVLESHPGVLESHPGVLESHPWMFRDPAIPTPRKFPSFTRLSLQLSSQFGNRTCPYGLSQWIILFLWEKLDSRRHRSGIFGVLSAGTDSSLHLRRNCRGQKGGLWGKVSCRKTFLVGKGSVLNQTNFCSWEVENNTPEKEWRENWG